MITENEKQEVLEWMRQHALWSVNARKKEDILKYIYIHERKLRLIMSELKHEGHICSTSQDGYWAFDIEKASFYEIEKAKHNWQEMRSRAMSMLKDCDKHLERLNSKVTQREFIYG